MFNMTQRESITYWIKCSSNNVIMKFNLLLANWSSALDILWYGADRYVFDSLTLWSTSRLLIRCQSTCICWPFYRDYPYSNPKWRLIIFKAITQAKRKWKITAYVVADNALYRCTVYNVCKINEIILVVMQIRLHSQISIWLVSQSKQAQQHEAITILHIRVGTCS